MPAFHPLTIADIRRETADCVSIAFDVPESLKTEFAFQHGQYLTLRTTLQGEEVRRSYSICSGVAEGELRVAVKQVPEGQFSTFANTVLKVGEVLDVMPPLGRFTSEIDPKTPKHYALFAAGSGITPMLSIIKTVLAAEPESTVTLVYGNKNIHSVIFREELEDIKDTHMGRFRLFHVMSREANEVDLFSGRIDTQKCEAFTESFLPVSDIDQAFVCGPEEMIHAVKDTLIGKGLDANCMHFELFTTAGAAPRPVLTEEEVASGPQTKATVTLYGQRWEFDMSREEFVLDAAARQGLDLPYSCKGGMCCTCRAKLLEGDVNMEVNYALYPDEVADGFVLTCQSRPTSDAITVDFDQQ